MNKIIQKQEIVPPWIEKQQELVSTATRFRGRLRSDWKRHAARLIASRGGSLVEQIRKAEEYAAAEAILNPSKRKVEKLNAVTSNGQVSQITLAGELKITSDDAAQDEAVSHVNVTEESMGEDSQSDNPSVPKSNMDDQKGPMGSPLETSLKLFRDQTWEETEQSYHTVAINNLNTMTRSYNLMAPDLAKKPYFSLARELRSCYSDVAPLLAQELSDRAAAPPKSRVEVIGHTPGGVLERFGGEKARIWDENKPQYGFKEFWRDLFGGKESASR
jgi:hypothetical protein